MRKRRKNYLPAVILILVLWSLLGAMIYWVEPELVKDMLVPGLYLPFFLLFSPACFFTLAIVLANTRKGLLVTIGLTGFLILRVYQLGNLLNLLLLAGMVVAVERYLES
jgi:hypothetical protein